MKYNTLCIETLHKPTLSDLKIAIKALSSALKRIECNISEGPSWLIALCPEDALIEASVLRPRGELVEGPPRLTVLIRISGSNREIFEVSKLILHNLREIGIPLEIVPGCLGV
ncbi:MAG: hypothetical protein LRS46_02820 [Desulfurococcales archaeon]|nr:hypothetical protein [Desulfurococcales archaeon]